MIHRVFALFALPWVPWALSAVLVLAALAVWLHFRWRLRAVARGLEEALHVVQEADGPGAFRDRFPSLHQRLGANPIVGEGWRAFAQTLVPVPGRDDALGATRRPTEDLNESLLVHAGLNLRFYTAVPNYLVGLGLLFTFLGLIAALHFASAGVAAASVEAAQGSLRDLLTAATFKFVTSIAGLGASIVYSSREKIHLYQIGRQLTLLCTALEQRLVPVTPEYLGTVQLLEMRTQTTLLRRLGRHLHVTIPETVEERVAEELVEAIQPMREGFARAAARLGELDARVIDGLLQALTPGPAALPGRAPGLVEPEMLPALMDELRALRDALQGLPEALAGTLPAARPQPAMRRLAEALPGLVELLETSSEGLRALERRLERSQQRLKGASERAAARAPVRAEDGDLAGASEAVALARRELNELGRAFREVARHSRATVEALASGDGAGQPDPASALEDLARSVQGFNDRVRGFIGRADEELARSSQLLGGAVETLDGRPEP